MRDFISSISPGDWLKIAGMLFLTGTLYANNRTDLATLRADVDRHDALLHRLDETQRIALQNQAVLQQRFADHLDRRTDERHRTQGN